jgi:hypothetical protein
MKKLALSIAIVLGLSLTSFADPNGGGLFQRGESTQQGMTRTDTPMLPTHGETTNQDAPVGSGIAVLLGLGAAYLVGKKRREE